ncbi:hypothetical protein G3N59_10480 [Paraburkholderia sp. Ac-20340]|nr:hypothetical protein [Paraburkholderia sp. Ac-20340]MBN3853806.1 hypothetical protein [Paraburkholderia sp. Ac-20340]
MKNLLSLIALWGRVTVVLALLAFLVATLQQVGGAEIARAGGFWSMN